MHADETSSDSDNDEGKHPSHVAWPFFFLLAFPVPFLLFHVWFLLLFHDLTAFYHHLICHAWVLAACIWTIAWYVHHYRTYQHTLALCQKTEHDLQTWEEQYASFRRAQFKDRCSFTWHGPLLDSL